MTIISSAKFFPSNSYHPFFFTILLLLNTIHLLAQEEKSIYTDKHESIERRVVDLLSKMTLEEKVAQMRVFHANQGISADQNQKLQLNSNVINRLSKGIGGIKNPGEFLSPEQAAKLNNQLQQYIISNNRLGIPALFITESYNGVDAAGSTKFGRPISMAATFNTTLVQKAWDIIGREARLRGMHMCHSPEADIVRDPRFGRMSEAFGEDTHLTTEMVVAAVKGVQGNGTGLKSTHIGAVVKHFAAYGQVQGGTNFAAIEISPRTLIDEIFPPFQAAIQRAGALGVMASHGDINGIASHANPYLLTEVLRNQWGFKGYTVSDANDIARLFFFMKVAESPEAAAIMALKAGMDVDLYSDSAYALLPKLTQKNPDLIKFIDQSAGRVLRTKFLLGLFDSPYINEAHVTKEVHNQSARDLAYQIDVESIILLKNDTMMGRSQKPILPLVQQTPLKIALVGPVLDEEATAVFKKNAPAYYSFDYEKGFELTDRNKDIPKLTTDNEMGIQRILTKAAGSDVVILFLGGDEFTAKEGFFNHAYGDRNSIDLVGQQDELFSRIKSLGKPVIVVLKHRRTLSINLLAKQADAIIDCWDLGENGMDALSNIIFGKAVPSGKLPVTVPRTIGQIPFHYSRKEINNKKGYLFSENGPLYPFGFGLSYNKFTYSNLQITHAAFNKKSKVTASVMVTNLGAFPGFETVQWYIKDIHGQVVRPDKELKHFEKVYLQPGASIQVFFDIDESMLQYSGLTMERIAEPGTFKILVGGNSVDLLNLSLQLN